MKFIKNHDIFPDADLSVEEKVRIIRRYLFNENSQINPTTSQSDEVTGDVSVLSSVNGRRMTKWGSGDSEVVKNYFSSYISQSNGSLPAKKHVLEFLEKHNLFPNVIDEARIKIVMTKVFNERQKYRATLLGAEENEVDKRLTSNENSTIISTIANNSQWKELPNVNNGRRKTRWNSQETELLKNHFSAYVMDGITGSFPRSKIILEFLEEHSLFTNVSKEARIRIVKNKLQNERQKYRSTLSTITVPITTTVNSEIQMNDNRSTFNENSSICSSNSQIDELLDDASEQSYNAGKRPRWNDSEATVVMNYFSSYITGKKYTLPGTTEILEFIKTHNLFPDMDNKTRLIRIKMKVYNERQKLRAAGKNSLN